MVAAMAADLSVPTDGGWGMRGARRWLGELAAADRGISPTKGDFRGWERADMARGGRWARRRGDGREWPFMQVGDVEDRNITSSWAGKFGRFWCF